MSLLDRYRANECGFVGCKEQRTPSSALCGHHLNMLNRHELDRLDDHTFVERRRFAPRDNSGWIRSAA